MLLWVPAWLIVGLPLYGFFRMVVPTDSQDLSGLLALAVWFSVFMFLRQRVAGMRCFRCRRRAFEQLGLPLQVSRCKHCGASNET